MAETDDQGDLTKEQYERFVSENGRSPRVYRVTPQGLKEFEKYVKEKKEI